MLKNPLIQYAGIPVSTSDLCSFFPDLAFPEKKILSLAKGGALLRLKRNLYIVNNAFTGIDTDVRVCANHIYGPSYVSLQWTMRYYGMIPEQVFQMTCVTTKRSRSFNTPIGTFSYMQVPEKYFPIGIETIADGNVCFLMATREKALCDTILYDNFVPYQSLTALSTYLEEDLRLDMDTLKKLDTKIILECAKVGIKSQILTNLVKLIEK